MDVLNTSNRCDACGARAYMVFIMPRGQDLSFCGHHGTQYEQQVAPMAISIIDERASIFQKVDVSA